jgi:ATP-dependent DNA helicase RecG
MKPSLNKLHKFFKLEAERNYDNRAVVGGLERMLEPWRAEALSDGLQPELIEAVVSRLRDYSKLTSSSRAEVLEGVWKRIQRESGEKLPPLAPANPPDNVVPHRQPKPAQPTAQTVSLDVEYVPDTLIQEQSEAIGQDTGKRAEPKPISQTPKSKSSASHPTPVRQPPSGPPAAMNASVTVLPGVGPRHAVTLSHLGLQTLGDMLYYFPRRYDYYSQLKPINRLWYGEEVTVIGSVDSVQTRTVRGGKMQIVEAVISDGTGSLRVTWFNQPWITRRLQEHTQIVLSGKVEQYLGRLTMNSPEWEPLEVQTLHTNRIVPVYPLTANITQRWLRRLMYQVVTYWAPRVADPMPARLRQEASIVDLPTALLQSHFPDNAESLKAARYRLAFDEIFLLQLGVLGQKRVWQARTARQFDTPEEWLQERLTCLPFPLTAAQLHALEDVRADLSSGRPMNRLLQGDVGSGKTIIAALGVMMIARHAAQSAIMAPTSILAEQHYQNMLQYLTGSESPLLHPSEVRLLVSATPDSEKSDIRAGLEEGSIKLVVGTHALIENPVIFANLQFIVVDEQHRFGVEQRALLRAKGDNPHLLVMTATPIPRSLALTIYGDLDLTIIDEMPPGRQPIETNLFYPRERERAYAFIRSQVEKGFQAFIIYPLVEESEDTDTLAAVQEHARLQKEVFPNLQLGLLHGRMKAEDKDSIMAQFRDGDLHILVSTSVVEVGVDVPNASVMLVEGANRFGLAQLHQFRGRVGRGSQQAYCILIPDTPAKAENERLSAMTETNDGFVLAERDLEQRGPGDFLGTRQAGYPQLRLSSLADVHLIEKARRHAQALFETDPLLEHPEHTVLASSLKYFWSKSPSDIS